MKFTIIGLLTLASAIAAYTTYHQSDDISLIDTSPFADLRPASVKALTYTKNKPASIESTNGRATVPVRNSIDYDSEASRAVLAYYQIDESYDYFHYDDETLWQLVERGDFKAMAFLNDRLLTLMKKYHESGDDEMYDKTIKEKLDLAYIGLLAGGATYAPSLATLSSVNSGISTDYEERRAYAKEYAVWVEVGLLMGDILMLRRGVDKLNRTSKDMNIVFSDSELTEISNKADRIYQHLEEERIDRGWGPYPERKSNSEIAQSNNMPIPTSLTRWGDKYLNR